jgi:hypothetical protein
MRWHPNESFALTIPNEADQKRLKKQKRWRRLGNYVPNSLSPGTRLLFSGVVLAWAGWSGIGLLFGHMFWLVSRRGLIHFSGLAALLFSATVLTVALILAAHVVDHYDKRDNEEVYQQVRAWLWRVAISLFVLTWMIGCSTSVFLSDTRTFTGLVETENVAGFLTSSWVAERLAPIHGSFLKWLFFSFGWLALCAAVARLASPRQLPPLAGSIALLVIALPALTATTLFVLWVVVGGDGSAFLDADEDMVRFKVAFASSVLVVLAILWWLLVVGVIALVVRAFSRPAGRPVLSSDL